MCCPHPFNITVFHNIVHHGSALIHNDYPPPPIFIGSSIPIPVQSIIQILRPHLVLILLVYSAHLAPESIPISPEIFLKMTFNIYL